MMAVGEGLRYALESAQSLGTVDELTRGDYG